MAAQTKCHEQYPWWIVFLSNFVSIAMYVIGGYILYQLGPIWLALYLLYILLLEARLLRKSCTNCYYYGKTCAFGKGKLSAVFFKRGDAKRFAQDQITWKELIPEFLASIIPFLAGIVLLITNFTFLMLSLVLLLGILTSAGNGFIRSSLACKHCKQRELGCPAEKLFRKN
jgi:hypothetical protein